MMDDARRLVVTGGASGIGAAVVAQALNAGIRVAVFDLDASSAPDGARLFDVDIRDADAIAEAVADLVAEWGGIDALVNNAGVGSRGSVVEATDDDWLTVLDTNVVGTARVSRAVLPHLRESATPRVVNVSSVSAVLGVPDRAVYSASKGAVAALTRAMAADHVRDGVLVNCVLPGTTDTPWIQRLLDDAPDSASLRATFDARQPTGRMTTVEDVATVVMMLLNPALNAITGEAIVVDGGMRALRLEV